MTLAGVDDAGLGAAGRMLDAGRPVVLPLPTPLPYVIAGVDAAAVNVAKGRPADQPAGMVVADLGLVAPHVRLDADTLAFARWLSGVELVNLLLPVDPAGPGWLRPSISRGRLGVMLGWLPRLRPVLDGRGHLYVSSANRTGEPVAVTAAGAAAAFGTRLLVVDGDELRDPAAASGSATMIALGADREIEVVRHGVNDADVPAGGYPGELRRRWEAHRAEPGRGSPSGG